MRFARAGRAVMAAVLLAASGCDYWDNLVENKTVTRTDLEVKVIDAWTGNTLPDAVCRDSLRSLSGTTDEQGVFRIVAGNTGEYAFNCSHEWYYDGAADFHLTKAGGHVVAKLARRGEPGNWYPGDFGTVAILLTKGQDVRFPVDLDWQVVPTDTTGRFRYEWTFLQAKNLDRGHWVNHVQLDPQAYAPHFRARVNDPGVQGGSDTVILKVYSMMAQKESGGYLVGSDTLPFVWVRNIKPNIHFNAPFDSIPPTFRVGCGSEAVFARVTLTGSDSDGECAKIELSTRNAPSLGKIDTILSCEEPNHNIKLRLMRPPGDAGYEEYENTLIAEITDDNGEKGRDSVTFKTYTNSLPASGEIIVNPRAAYFVGEPITFEVNGKDTDGGIQQLEIQWTGKTDGLTTTVPWQSPNFPYNASETHRFTKTFLKADTYQPVGKAVDNCGDSIAFNGPPFIVEQDTPPSILVSNLDTSSSSGGDSLYVQFDLTVTDEDQSNGDSLTAVNVYWGDANESDPNPASPYPKTITYKHGFKWSHLNPSQNIEIYAVDAHSGDSKYKFRIPELTRIP